MLTEIYIMHYLNKILCAWLMTLPLMHIGLAQTNAKASKASPRVTISHGILEGTIEQSGIRSFKGIPFAAPPVGDLRWREPQPLQKWQGVRKANQFGPRAMQLSVFGDMNFRSNGMSEDCLYLNVWTPAKSNKEKLPVLVYFYGGGFIAGDGSEPRYDGESMAKRGIVAVTVNYRLGAFGFMAHPELTKESPHKASGNYGLMDQNAALQWVKQNIAAFGGDPAKVTIAGESAGSFSVSAQMASPLSKDLIAGAIAESGSLLSLQPTSPLAQAEKIGLDFAKGLEANSLQELRAMTAEKILEGSGKQGPFRFPVTIDGYFFPKAPSAIFAAGEQAKVPLLAGWNSEEMNYKMLLGQDPPSPENYIKALKSRFGENAGEVLKLYPAATEAEVIQAGTDLAGDLFIGFSTWKLIDMHSQTSGQPVYRYMYERPRPPMTAEMGDAVPGLAGGVIKNTDASTPKPAPSKGAVHSAEIEYALGNLTTNKVYAWTKDDFKVSEIMQSYFANFIKSGNPNGKNLPEWPAIKPGGNVPVMHIDVTTYIQPEQNKERYLLLEKLHLPK